MIAVKAGGRIDHYLSGFTTKKFRSPNEFCPHLLWLMKGMPTTEEQHSTCDCCYCGGEPQKEINKRYWPITAGPSSHASSSSSSSKCHSTRLSQQHGITKCRGNGLISTLRKAPRVVQPPIRRLTIGHIQAQNTQSSSNNMRR